MSHTKKRNRSEEISPLVDDICGATYISDFISPQSERSEPGAFYLCNV